MTILEILNKAIELGAADIFLVAGLPVTFKCGGRQQRQPEGTQQEEQVVSALFFHYPKYQLGSHSSR